MAKRTTTRGGEKAGHAGAAPPVPGLSKVDPPLPQGGRQPQRPGQDGRAQEDMGERDREISDVADAESGVRTAKRPRGR